MKIFLVIFSFLSISSAFSQKLNNKIYRDLYRFYSMGKYNFTCNNTTDLSKCIRVTNLEDSINSDEFSIYKHEIVGIDDSSEGILIVVDSKVYIFDMSNISFIIENIINYKLHNTPISDNMFFKIVNDLVLLNKRNKVDTEPFILSKKIGDSTFYYGISSLK